MWRALRTWAFALALVTAVASSVRADVAGTTQQVGAAPGTTQTAPAISGSGVVWTNYDGTQFDIYYVDVATGGAPVNLTNSRDNEFLEDIDRGSVVFTHTGGPMGSPGDILLLDTAKGTIGNVAIGNSAVHFAHPAISGKYIVFERITTQYDIALYDLNSGDTPLIINDAAMQLHPRVSGNVVVYEDYGANPAGPPAVYGYRYAPLTSSPPFLIAANGRLPDVDGNSVVYVGPDAGGGDQIMLYDLSSRTTRALTSARSGKSSPRISGTRVVWTDNRSGNDDVWSLDLATNVEARVAGGAGSQATGDISGNRVVYSSTDVTGQNGGVYVFTFSGPPPSDLPVGCDPALTDLVDGPTQLAQTSNRAVTASRTFYTQTGRTYYLCVDNGLPNGTQRSAHVMAAVDGGMVLTPADFRPEQNPPAHVAVQLGFDGARDRFFRHATSNQHLLDVSLFAKPNTAITVSIRVAK